MIRRIVHIDMDAFYASVEQRDDASLRGKPVAVGGQPDKRGVVAAASYEARAFGVHSAMSMAKAVRLCPSLMIVPPDFARYKAASTAVFSIFREVGPVDALWGVGSVTAHKLRARGIERLVDVRTADVQLLRDTVGSLTDWLRQLASGVDDRPVVPNREVKSSGSENTYPEDLVELEAI